MLNRLSLVIYWLCVAAFVGGVIVSFQETRELSRPEHYERLTDADRELYESLQSQNNGRRPRLFQVNQANASDDLIKYTQRPFFIIRGLNWPNVGIGIVISLSFWFAGWMFRFVLVGDATLYPPFSTKEKSNGR